MAVFDIIVWPLLVTLSLAVAYLYVLALFGLLDRRRRPQPSDNWRTLVLIPAHNEEDGIDTSLDSLERLESFGVHEIVVIADNCSDNTAEVVRQRGVSVLERIDLSNRGKGYALQWAVDKLDIGSFDVVVVIDADTRVEPNMLRAVAASLQNNAGAVQLCNELSVERHTPLAHLQHMANAVENHLFWGGRAKLRLPILLRGTGMAIAAHLLEKHPFSGEALAEDTDYSIDLLKNGVRIDFSTDSTVRSAAASSYSQALSQKDRWASGTFQSMRERWWPLVKTGLGQGRGSLLELAWAFLLLSRPFLIYLTVLAMIPAIFAEPSMRLWYLGWAAALAILLVVYLMMGVVLVSDKAATARALLHIPYFAIWLLVIQVKAIFGGRKKEWVRTTRLADRVSSKSLKSDRAEGPSSRITTPRTSEEGD